MLTTKPRPDRGDAERSCVPFERAWSESGSCDGAAPTASTGAQLVALARQTDANQYRIVHLAASYDEGLAWFHRGCKSAAAWISAQLGIHSSTAREWIRVGYALRQLPAIDTAFAAGEISYAKVRILTRWADPDNEVELLELAHQRNADRLTTAIAKRLAADGETDEQRDARHHEARALTTWTTGDGMTIIRLALPPAVAKPVLAAIDELVRRLAATPAHAPAGLAGGPAGASPSPSPMAEGTPAPSDEHTHRGEPASAGAFGRRSVAGDGMWGGQSASAGASGRRSVAGAGTWGGQSASAGASGRRRVAGDGTWGDGDWLRPALDERRRRWQPTTDDVAFPSLAQQRADAFAVLFLGLGVELVTEIVIHVRGDGITFDDGTPTTTSAVLRQLDDAFIRLMIHDCERRPVNASSRRRHPTTAQRRVVMETHHHECVDCQSTDLLELDHNPPYHRTGHTVTSELEPRCGPCHRARHRHDAERDGGRRVPDRSRW